VTDDPLRDVLRALRRVRARAARRVPRDTPACRTREALGKVADTPTATPRGATRRTNAAEIAQRWDDLLGEAVRVAFETKLVDQVAGSFALAERRAAAKRGAPLPDVDHDELRADAAIVIADVLRESEPALSAECPAAYLFAAAMQRLAAAKRANDLYDRAETCNEAGERINPTDLASDGIAADVLVDVARRVANG
jgi:hypothetical protein